MFCQSVCDQCVTEMGLLGPTESIEAQDQGPGTPYLGACTLGMVALYSWLLGFIEGWFCLTARCYITNVVA